MFISNKIISNPGLSGFSPVGDSGWLILISQILRLIDIYIIWQILLLILGVRLSAGLTTTKSSSGVIFTVMLILLLQAGISYLGSLLGNLTITRPFFF
jgi:prolipoprotein diacylglyceryltransferase